MSDTFDTALKVVRIVSPLTAALVDLVSSSNTSVNDASDKGIDILKEELEKQKIRMEYDAHQAKIAQELAIAVRIENAEEVEIEEYYDTQGKGSAGLNFDAKANTGSIGLSGEGRSVTKRIIRFKGIKNTPSTPNETERTKTFVIQDEMRE